MEQPRAVLVLTLEPTRARLKVFDQEWTAVVAPGMHDVL